MNEKGEGPYPTGFNYVKDFISYVHIKDCVKNLRVVFLEIGKGQAKIEENLRVLKENNYREYISLETHWRVKKALNEVQIKLPRDKEY